MIMYKIFGKRLFDYMTALAGIFAILPILLPITWSVKKRLGNPIFFRQIRPGMNGRPFEILKFRTMTDDKDMSGAMLPDSERLTPFGEWMRRTSLDELPELFNVIKGDMSLVGPRPLLTQYLDRYSPEQARRHDAKPGITGWAQVNGRNAISWEDKFKLDVWYVDNLSLQLDLKIIMMTFIRVIGRDGINQPGHATAEEFRGSLDTMKVLCH